MTDVFRKAPQNLSDDQRAYIEIFKDTADMLWAHFTDANFLQGDARAMAIAKTKLEECVMWAVKSIT